MTAWRMVFAVGLGVVVGLPLVQPFSRLLEPAVWTWSGDDLGRIAHLAANTAILVGGTCALAVPAGTFLALVLFRTQMGGRRAALALLVVALFVPLPVIVSSWQSLLGTTGMLPVGVWADSAARPWATGMGPAIWVHAVAATPWVTWIVGLGLAWVEPELEEAALLQVPPWRVLLHVTLPRCRASIAVATLFVALQTASEIAVTDMMLVFTLAEEVYNQFTIGDNGLGRTLLLSLPGLIGMAGVLVLVAQRLERALPPLPALLRAPRSLVERPGWPVQLVTIIGLAILIVPMGSLFWKVGVAGQPRHWSVMQAWHLFANESRLLGDRLLESLATALAGGALAASIALAGCWLARDSRWLRTGFLILLAAAWIMPGPVVGIGLKELLQSAAFDLRQMPDGPLREVLYGWNRLIYNGPSPVPVLWANVLRFLPAAFLFLWPVVRLLPQNLIEAARVEGAGPIRELLLVVWPMTWRAVAVIAIAVTALALGEIAVAGRAQTPGWEVFAKLLFDRMHYGADSNVAALSLLLLVAVAALGIVILVVRLRLAPAGAVQRSASER